MIFPWPGQKREKSGQKQQFLCFFFLISKSSIFHEIPSPSFGFIEWNCCVIPGSQEDNIYQKSVVAMQYTYHLFEKDIPNSYENNN